MRAAAFLVLALVAACGGVRAPLLLGPEGYQLCITVEDVVTVWRELRLQVRRVDAAGA